MEFKQITSRDLPLVAELLELSNGNGAYGRGYPKGTLEGLTHEYAELGATLLEQFYLVGDNLGIFGIFDAPWGLYLIGPIFQPKHHSVDNMVAILEGIFQLPSLKCRKLAITVLEENQVMLEAVQKAGFSLTYEGVAMEYDLTGYPLKEISAQMVEISTGDLDALEQINGIFKEDLEPWGNRTVEDLVEMLEDETQIAALKQDGCVAGAIIWSADPVLLESELEYVCVKKEFQGQGYGKLLVDYAANALKLLGIKDWYLDTARSNVRAQQFYLNHGFNIEYIRYVYEKQIL